MAIGDQNDFQSRIIGDLPPWFGDVIVDPIVSGLVAAGAYVMSTCYAVLGYVRPQTRIRTATDGWLDLASQDYLGDTLPRKTAESDTAFRSRILANLLGERATRPGMIKALTVLTGNAPVIFEPWRPADAACANASYAGVSRAGSYTTPAQAFITVTLPPGDGGGGIAGAATNYAGAGCGYMAAADASTLGSAIADEDVYNTVNAFKAEGTTMWVEINN